MWQERLPYSIGPSNAANVAKPSDDDESARTIRADSNADRASGELDTTVAAAGVASTGKESGTPKDEARKMRQMIGGGGGGAPPTGGGKADDDNHIDGSGNNINNNKMNSDTLGGVHSAGAADGIDANVAGAGGHADVVVDRGASSALMKLFLSTAEPDDHEGRDADGRGGDHSQANEVAPSSAGVGAVAHEKHPAGDEQAAAAAAASTAVLAEEEATLGRDAGRGPAERDDKHEGKVEEGAGPERRRSWLGVGGVLGTDDLYLRNASYLKGVLLLRSTGHVEEGRLVFRRCFLGKVRLLSDRTGPSSSQFFLSVPVGGLRVVFKF